MNLLGGTAIFLYLLTSQLIYTVHLWSVLCECTMKHNK